MRALFVMISALLLSAQAHAFCGFYVGQADADLFNKASKVVYTRIGDSSTITMASDYEGPLDQFAMVVPVPTIIEEDDVRTVDPGIVDHLDRYSAPRLVEYHDDDPCSPVPVLQSTLAFASEPRQSDDLVLEMSAQLGVTIEREFKVDGYEIIILSATRGSGLLEWLNLNDYQTPDKALPVLADYIDAGMKFFVAKVDLGEMESAEELNPLQVTFESDEFMLPIRLGMTNAIPGEDQELVAWFLTDQGQVEVQNYPFVRIPTDADIPNAVREDFGGFYQAVFDTAHERQGARSVFFEYGWDMGWCDPCAADPLSEKQLVELGVPQGTQAYVSRVHMRYNEDTHAEDLMLRVTNNRQNFQGRYIINNPFDVSWTDLLKQCARDYRREVRVRQVNELATLSELTGGWEPEISATDAAAGSRGGSGS